MPPPLVKHAVLRALLLLAIAPVLPAAGQTPGTTPSATESPGTQPSATVAADPSLLGDIEFLSSDKLKGRSSADATIHQAAEFVAQRMQRIGLVTEVIDDQPFQRVTVRLGARPGAEENNQVRLYDPESDGSERRLTLGEEMNPMAIGTARADLTGALVFAGYGATAPDLDYDDYAGIDVENAVVIVLRKEPGANDPQSRFQGTENTKHAFFATKIQNAIEQGAAAVLLVNDPASITAQEKQVTSRIQQEKKRRESIKGSIDKLPEAAVNSRKALEKQLATIDQQIKGLRREREAAKPGLMEISTAGTQPFSEQTIPVASVSREAISRLFQDTVGQTLEEIEAKIDETGSPASFVVPNFSADLKVELKPTDAESDNVIGILPGKGKLADQTLVIGAHYDHVGMGGYGSLAPGTVAVHNGADDNASGTAGLLAIAEQLVSRIQDRDSHRQIVFIAFTGEERGLLGSKAYVANPVVPIEKTVAMLNLDMVGRLRDNELTVYGTGTAKLLDQLLEQANQETAFDLFKVPTGYGPSDHQNFYMAGVPVLHFFTGLHNDYHRPSDDFDKIDFGGLSRITDIVSEVAFQLAVGSQRPEYAKTENRVQMRRQLTAYIGVRLSERDDHVVISGVTAGGPAERGGLQIDDRLEKLGKQQTRTAADVLRFLRNHAPGDQVKVTVQRNGKPVAVTIKLDARPGG